MKTRAIHATVLVVAASTLVAGCTSETGVGVADQLEVGAVTRPTATAEPARVVTYEPLPKAISMAAGAVGVLVIEDGCLRLDNGLVPVFPASEVTWDGSILTWAGRSYSIGETIRRGGGRGGDPGNDTGILAGCGDGDSWSVGQHRDG